MKIRISSRGLVIDGSPVARYVVIHADSYAHEPAGRAIVRREYRQLRELGVSRWKARHVVVCLAIAFTP